MGCKFLPNESKLEISIETLRASLSRQVCKRQLLETNKTMLSIVEGCTQCSFGWLRRDFFGLFILEAR